MKQPVMWRGHSRYGSDDAAARPRARRGEVRVAVLLLLEEESRTGYELMADIEQRSGGAWRPSPGSVYPTLARLQDEGLATVRDLGGRRVFQLTPSGRQLAETHRASEAPWLRFREMAPGRMPDLRILTEQLVGAVSEVERVGSREQRSYAAEQLARMRRELYRMLAG